MDSPEKKNEPAGSTAGLLAAVSSGFSMFGNAMYRSVNTLLGKEGMKVSNPEAGKEKDDAAADLSKQERSSHCTKSSKAALRLLCPAFAVGGVIGHGGSLVKNMERQIGVSIRFSAAVPHCGVRVVTVFGSSDVCRTVRLRGLSGRKGELDLEEEEEEVVQVSAVQEALLGIFERVLEVEAEMGRTGQADGGERVSCSLLADEMQCAILFGKYTNGNFSIFTLAGARVQILSAGSHPARSSPADRVIQLKGGIFGVKKALLAASEVLQDRPPVGHEKVVMDSPTTENVPVATVPRQAWPDRDAGGSAAKEAGPLNSASKEDKPCNVVFKMICSINEAKAVIGIGGSTMTLLQNESGAFIRFAPAVDGHRIATISAMEGFRSSYSQAQNALIRIVAKLAEVTARNSSGRVLQRIITVRLVITPAQADSLRHKEFLLKKISDVEIQMLEGDLASLETEKILSVAGEYKAVQNALLRVTKELRDGCFSSSTLKGAGAPNGNLCAIPDIDTSRISTNANSLPPQKSLLKSPNISQESKISGKNHVQSKISGKNHAQSSNGSSGRLWQPKEKGKGKMPHSDPESVNHGGAVVKVTVAVEVPEHAFDSVWGENGANIFRIREISAADVQVQAYPAGGKTKYTFVMSGEPAQVLAAQSLLQAFIQAAS